MVTPAGREPKLNRTAGQGRRSQFYALTWPTTPQKEVAPMLRLALLFFLLSLIAGVLGFSGVAGAAALVAKVLFGVFLALFAGALALALFGLSLFKR